MLARSFLAVALAAAPAALGAGRAWVVEDAIVTVEHGPKRGRVSAVSTELKGAVTQPESGLATHLTLPAGSLHTGHPGRDGALQALAGEIVIDAATTAAEGATRLRGTLTFHGVARPLDVPLTLSRSGSHLWAHAAFNLRLRDFGEDLPDEPLSFEVDAGLRPAGSTVASR